MRKMCFSALLCLVLLWCGGALASRWGMSGEMHEFLKQSGQYRDYTDIRSGYDRSAPCFPFIASDGEHSQLVVVRRNSKGQLEQVGRYPTAVLQPSVGRKAECWLGDEGNGVHLTPMWGNTGDYVRIGWDDTDEERAEENLLLWEAEIGELTFILREDKAGYLVSDGLEEVLWATGGIRASEFCWAMIPETLEDVQACNQVYDMIGASGVFDGRHTVDLHKNRNLPVYAAPSEDAWRGAKGRAMVSLKEPFDVLDTVDGWWLIEYDITPAKRRIGYVRIPEGAETMAVPLSLRDAVITLRCDASLTDDPHGEGETVAVLRKGTQLRCFGWANAFWAWVETEVDGRAARGFIPISAVDLNDRVIE